MKHFVQGGTSGIGYAAIKVAKAFGANVFATARNKVKCDAILRFGADCAINYRAEDFVDIVQTEQMVGALMLLSILLVAIIYQRRYRFLLMVGGS